MICNKCGTSFPDDSAFCPGCGNEAVATAAPTPPNQKRNLLLYTIVVVLVVTLAAVVLYFTLGGNRDKKEDKSDKADASVTTTQSEATTTTTTTPTTRPSSIQLNGKYDLGYFDGEYYVNEWADLKLKIPTYWEDKGSGTIEAANTAIALYRVDEESRGLVQVMLIDRMGENFSPHRMIDMMIDELADGDDVTFETPSDNVKMGTHTGTGVIGWLKAGGETYCVGMFACEVDDCIVFVDVIGYNRDAMADMMLDFTGV